MPRDPDAPQGNPVMTALLVGHPERVARLVAHDLARPMPDEVMHRILDDMGLVTDRLHSLAPSSLKAYGLGKQDIEAELRRRLSA